MLANEERVMDGDIENQDPYDQKQIVSSKVSSIQLREFFSHHPNCSQYDHHVLKLGKWRFCLGCTSMYFAFVFAFIVDLIIFPPIMLLDYMDRLTIGFILFIPAIIRLKFKSNNKIFKYLKSLSLGFALWFFISGTYSTYNLILQLLGLILFSLGVYLYSILISKTRLIECDSCDFNQQYQSCLIKYSAYLKIDNLEIIEKENILVSDIIDLKRRSRHDKAIILPLVD